MRNDVLLGSIQGGQDVFRFQFDFITIKVPRYEQILISLFGVKLRF